MRPAMILIPDGVAIRNFLFSRFLPLMLQERPVSVWHALPAETIDSIESDLTDRIEWHRLPSFREGFSERVLRQAKIYAQLYNHYSGKATEVMLRQRRPRGSWKSHVVGRLAQLVGRLHASDRGTISLDRRHYRVTARAGYLEPFQKHLETARPAFLFCAHQRASRAVPAMVAARELGIPTATFIYSWDNLPKGRMAVHADRYLTWSDHMSQELLRYYPEVDPSRVVAVGTPQFEPLFDRSLVEPREAFLERLGLDPARAVICFAGSDTSASPHDPQYLDDLAAGLASFTDASPGPQILFRPSPADRSERYDPVLEKYPRIVRSTPEWLQPAESDWTGILPTRADTALLANVVHHCDVVVSCGSTMAMDFALLDKPGIYVTYTPTNEASVESTLDVFSLPHFESVRRIQPVYCCTRGLELGALVKRVLDAPSDKAKPRTHWLKTLLLDPYSQACARSVQALLATIQTVSRGC